MFSLKFNRVFLQCGIQILSYLLKGRPLCCNQSQCTLTLSCRDLFLSADISIIYRHVGPEDKSRGDNIGIQLTQDNKIPCIHTHTLFIASVCCQSISPKNVSPSGPFVPPSIHHFVQQQRFMITSQCL